MKNYYQPLKIQNNTISAVSNKTLENSSINITDVNQYVDPSTVSLKVDDHCIGDETKVMPYLKAGTESFEFTSSTDTYSTIYVYVAITSSDEPSEEIDDANGKDTCVLFLDPAFVHEPALIRYNIVSGSPDGSPTVIDGGKFLPQNTYEAKILSRVTGVNIPSGSEGNGYVLGSTFEIEDQAWDTDDGLNALTISCSLKACYYTLTVFGGSGYQLGDTFTLTDGAVTAVYEVGGLFNLINSNEDSGGAVLDIRLVSSDSGFTNTPTVTYNGSTGSGATITVNDNYGIGSVSIVNASNMGYINDDALPIAAKFDGDSYTPDRFAYVVLSTESGDDSVTFTDKLLLHSFEILKNGNNIRDDSTLALKDSSGVLENVVEITSSIDTPDTDVFNRTTY
jgi:hypothetical protein